MSLDLDGTLAPNLFGSTYVQCGGNGDVLIFLCVNHTEYCWPLSQWMSPTCPVWC